MNTLEEVNVKLAELEAEGGKTAVRMWLMDHAAELPEDVRDDVIFKYSTDALLEDAADQQLLDGVIAEGVDALDQIEARKKLIQDEIAKLDIKERLHMGGSAAA